MGNLRRNHFRLTHISYIEVTSLYFTFLRQKLRVVKRCKDLFQVTPATMTSTMFRIISNLDIGLLY